MLLHQIDTSSAPPHPPGEWRALVEARIRSGQRVLTLFGRPLDHDVLVTAVLQHDQHIEVVRARVDRTHGYHALTPEFPGLHCFERELHEQHGVRIGGHPWLKPIRFEGGNAAARDAYPFYKIDGKEVHEVAVGPVHAGGIEPGSFRFMCHGEQVHHLEIHLGYQHRGVERLLLRGDPRRHAPLVETIAGDSSVAHGWAYCAAIEALTGVSLAPEADAARAVLLELERIAMHLSGLAGMAADVGHLQGGSTYGRLRTTAINTSMGLCGSRFGRGAMRPGGLGARLGVDGAMTLEALRRNLALLRSDTAVIDDCLLQSRTVQHRLVGVGQITRERAAELGLVGPAARASGVEIDARSLAGGVYADIPVQVVVEPGGDCWARTRIRVEEIRRSLAFIDAAIERWPSWAAGRRALERPAPDRLVVAVVEGWRGEVVHCLETDGGGDLVHYKVQDPSLRNWLGLAIAVRENEISDFPICNKSFDLSYCGNDL